jgi:hypothetical protein
MRFSTVNLPVGRGLSSDQLSAISFQQSAKPGPKADR